MGDLKNLLYDFRGGLLGLALLEGKIDRYDLDDYHHYGRCLRFILGTSTSHLKIGMFGKACRTSLKVDTQVNGHLSIH